MNYKDEICGLIVVFDRYNHTNTDTDMVWPDYNDTYTNTDIIWMDHKHTNTDIERKNLF